MKLWKILLATMIALLLVSAVAMADTCDHEPGKYEVSKTTVGPIKAEQGCVYYVETKYACANCTWTYTDTDSYTEDHDFPAKADAKYYEATCEKGSYRVYTCSVCGYQHTEAGATPATGHSPVTKTVVEATCTTKGKTETKCQWCGLFVSEAETPAMGHSSVLEYSEDATCTQEGKWYGKCKREGCGVIVESGAQPKDAHDIETIGVTAAECASWGHKVTAYNKCKTCGEITYKAAKNEWDGSAAAEPNGCGEEGHSAYLYCSVCEAVKPGSKTIYPALTHDYTIQVSYTAATCLNDGVRVMQCKVRNVNGAFCDDTVEVVVPATGHTHSDLWQVKVAATCTEDGIEENLCKTCGLDAQYRTIEKKGHNFYSAKEIIANFGNAYQGSYPGCETDGYAYAKCKNGCQADQYVVLPATGHNWGSWVMAEYDCEDGTVGTRECATCGKDDEKVFVEGAGHKWLVTDGVDATCEVAGVVDYKCEICDVTRANVYVPAKGHDGEVTAYTAATCTAEGSKTTKCDNCGKEVTETIAKVAHVYGWVTTAATPSANGKSEYKCAGCGDVKETKTIKYTKWYYNNTMTSFGPSTRELVGGNDWYRVTPVDLTVDGVYTYDLIASNKYVVGTVTITVNAGTLSVNYDAKYDVEIKDEALLIYASKADLAAGSAVTAAVGSAINTAETFGEDTKVLVSLILTGNYDAAGKDYIDEDAASALAANID